MKTKLLFSLFLLTAAVAPGALAAADVGDRNVHTGGGQLLITPVDDAAVKNVPTRPAVVSNDQKQVLRDYDSLMIALTQKFSATLATIAEAAKRGELSGERAREMSAEQYQVTHMQFELLSLWRGIEEQDSATIPDVKAQPDSIQESEVVMVALPFSSLQLNPSLARYLSLTSSQVEAIRQLMMREQRSLEPLMTALRTAREKLLAIGSEHVKEKQVKAVADTEASLLARLIVANARMQSKIYKILSPDQQKSSAISNERRAQPHRITGKGAMEATRVTAQADAELVVPHSLGLSCKTTTLQASAQSLAVSVLDLAAARAGEPAGSAIARAVEWARDVEQLGYERYGVAEHHTIQGLACSASPVPIGHMAAATKTIRAGSGRVMLPNHEPLVVAEQFGTLKAIYPGQIDVGHERAIEYEISNSHSSLAWLQPAGCRPL